MAEYPSATGHVKPPTHGRRAMVIQADGSRERALTQNEVADWAGRRLVGGTAALACALA